MESVLLYGLGDSFVEMNSRLLYLQVFESKDSQDLFKKHRLHLSYANFIQLVVFMHSLIFNNCAVSIVMSKLHVS
jgi:hypothetical protein